MTSIQVKEPTYRYRYYLVCMVSIAYQYAGEEIDLIHKLMA